jgi:thymidylate synthase (FAD)
MHTAKLDWITPDAEKVVARHARVSTIDPDRTEYDRLLGYCIKHGHWSVLEQAAASFEIITSRAISPQILRHRTFTFQELSQRYASPFDVIGGDLNDKPAEFSIRRQAEKNRQSSVEEMDSATIYAFKDRINRIDAQLFELYNDMLEAGVARECARNILPLYTPTKLHMQGTLRSWIHYVGLRGKEDTQLEHQQIARQIGTILALELPTITKAVIKSEDPSLQGWSFLRQGD